MDNRTLQIIGVYVYGVLSIAGLIAVGIARGDRGIVMYAVAAAALAYACSFVGALVEQGQSRLMWLQFALLVGSIAAAFLSFVRI